MHHGPALGRWASCSRAPVPSSRLRLTSKIPSNRRFNFTGKRTTKPAPRPLLVGNRTYADALRKLALLQSNRTTTQLFDQPSSPNADPNAAAIPEMIAWLRRAGYKRSDLAKMRHIHVAGTKGKGSVCAYATALLKRWRYLYGSTGTYTSPHLVSPRERIAINGHPVTQEVFTKRFFEVWDRMSKSALLEGMSPDEAEGPASKPFYFRFMTILAWHTFLSEGVKNVVLECGIGGEYDATNIVPENAVTAAVVTHLGIDHIAMLGDTVEKIAWHKAGIFKRGAAAFTRRVEDQPEVMKVLRNRAHEKEAKLVEITDETVDAWGGVKGSMYGGFQKYNQFLAMLAAHEHLGIAAETSARWETPWKDPEVIVTDLKAAKLRGRSEVLDDGEVAWMLDGAHNKDSLEGVAAWLASEIKPEESVVLVFNQMDRDASELLIGLFNAVSKATSREDVFSHALFTTNDPVQPPFGEQRDTSVQDKAAATMEKLRPKCDVQVYDTLTDAVEAARRKAGAKIAGQGGDVARQKILVTGSMHLVGGVLGILEPDAPS